MSKSLSSSKTTARRQFAPGPDADIWLNPNEAGEYTGKHPQTIRKACRERELLHSRKGRCGHFRIKKSALDAWMKRYQVTPRRQFGDE